MNIRDRILELATTTRVSIDTQERLIELRELTRTSPDVAMDALWKEIVSRRDYDDGMITCEYLALLVEIAPAETWSRFRQQWGQFSIETRRDLIWAARRNDVFSLEQWLEVFFDSSTSDDDRRLLLGAFVAGAYADAFAPHAVSCIRRIEQDGDYDLEYSHWLASVKSDYGVPR